MNLEKSIQKWKKSLYKYQQLEEGFIEELEDHLRHEINKQQAYGKSDEEAFRLAKEKLGSIAAVVSDEGKALSRTDNGYLLGLLRNFLKVSRRNFRKNKLTSAINLAGLTVSFAAIFLVGLFIFDELTYEKHHPDHDKIYRLSYAFTDEAGNTEERAFSSGMWIDMLKSRSPIVDNTFRYVAISYGYLFDPGTDKSFYEEGIYWSDPNFFEFLNFDLKYGQPENQLANLNSIILTETTSKKIFGDQDPLGKTLQYRRRSNIVNLEVTGVIYDPPSNSLFQPEYIGNMQAIQGIFGEHNRGWVDKNPNPGYVFTYLHIDETQKIDLVTNEMKAIWQEMIPHRAEFMEPLLTPLTDIHFKPPVKWEIDNPIDMTYIYGLGIIGIFILIIAMSNFINLTTAQGGKRRKEIGLRKTLGSTKAQLRTQFFLESTITMVAAFIIALGLVYLLMPWFNQVIDKRIDLLAVLLDPGFSFPILTGLLLLLAIVGLIPSLYFTRDVGYQFNLSEVFKKERFNSKGRNILVITQFTVAIILVIGSLTIYRQLNLINGGYLAQNQETVMGVRTSLMGDVVQAQRLKNEIEKIAGVSATTLGMHLPRQSDFGRINTRYFSSSTGDQTHLWNKFDADGGFLKTYNLKLLAGRDFDKTIQPNALIVNESLVESLGLTPQQALGVKLTEDSINYVFGSSDGMIIGVVADFAYKSIKESIEPLVICANNEVNGLLSIRVGEGNKQNQISQIEAIWNEIYPARPFEYWFLDKEFNRLYNQELRLGKLIPVFSGLAIVIALLGLFALTIYIVELRRKEIAIRKVLGSSTLGILRLIGQQFIYTLIPAICIAVPVGYFGMYNWLNNFEYRVSLDFGLIVLSVLAVILVSFATVSFHSFKAATNNPVDSLKYE